MSKDGLSNKCNWNALDTKYKGIVDPSGIDKLEEKIRKNPELQKYFKL